MIERAGSELGRQAGERPSHPSSPIYDLNPPDQPLSNCSDGAEPSSRGLPPPFVAPLCSTLLVVLPPSAHGGGFRGTDVSEGTTKDATPEGFRQGRSPPPLHPSSFFLRVLTSLAPNTTRRAARRWGESTRDRPCAPSCPLFMDIGPVAKPFEVAAVAVLRIVLLGKIQHRFPRRRRGSTRGQAAERKALACEVPGRTSPPRKPALCPRPRRRGTSKGFGAPETTLCRRESYRPTAKTESSPMAKGRRGPGRRRARVAFAESSLQSGPGGSYHDHPIRRRRLDGCPGVQP